MKLTNDQVKHVAKLANLPLNEEELNIYSEQLSEILDYFDQLNKVNTENAEPTFNPTESKNILREDTSGKSLKQEEALANAPIRKQGQFVTKGVFVDE